MLPLLVVHVDFAPYTLTLAKHDSHFIPSSLVYLNLVLSYAALRVLFGSISNIPPFESSAFHAAAPSRFPAVALTVFVVCALSFLFIRTVEWSLLFCVLLSVFGVLI